MTPKHEDNCEHCGIFLYIADTPHYCQAMMERDAKITKERQALRAAVEAMKQSEPWLRATQETLSFPLACLKMTTDAITEAEAVLREGEA